MWAFATTGRPSVTFSILIFSSETTGPIGTKPGKIDGAWVVPFQDCIWWSRSQPRWPPLLKIENSTKKNHLKSSPLKLTWPIGIRLWWNGPCVAPFQNYIRWLRLPTKIFFSPLTLPGEFLNIFYMNYAFDLTQNIAKTNIYTCCSSSNICICCSLCGFYRVEYCIATSGLVVWLVGPF